MCGPGRPVPDPKFLGLKIIHRVSKDAEKASPRLILSSLSSLALTKEKNLLEQKDYGDAKK